MMAPKFVVPYRISAKRDKNDAADASLMATSNSPTFDQSNSPRQDG
jgi:hypothetical protein